MGDRRYSNPLNILLAADHRAIAMRYDVVARIAGQGVLLDQTRPIAPFPEMPPPSAGLVEHPRRLGQKPPERASERLVGEGPHQQVHMIRHQGVGVHRHRICPDQLPQMGEQDVEIVRRGEIELPIIVLGCVGSDNSPRLRTLSAGLCRGALLGLVNQSSRRLWIEARGKAQAWPAPPRITLPPVLSLSQWDSRWRRIWKMVGDLEEWCEVRQICRKNQPGADCHGRSRRDGLLGAHPLAAHRRMQIRGTPHSSPLPCRRFAHGVM